MTVLSVPCSRDSGPYTLRPSIRWLELVRRCTTWAVPSRHEGVASESEREIEIEREERERGRDSVCVKEIEIERDEREK